MTPSFTHFLHGLVSVLLLKNRTSEVCKGVYMNLHSFLKQMINFKNCIIIAGPRHVMKQEIGVPYAFKS